MIYCEYLVQILYYRMMIVKYRSFLEISCLYKIPSNFSAKTDVKNGSRIFNMSTTKVPPKFRLYFDFCSFVATLVAIYLAVCRSWYMFQHIFRHRRFLAFIRPDITARRFALNNTVHVKKGIKKRTSHH